MGDISRALGSPITHTIGGKPYKLAPWSKRLQGEYEDWLEQLAFEAAQRRRKQLGEEKYEATLERITQSIVDGTYAITGKIAQKKLRTGDGLVRFVWLVMVEHQPELTEEDVRQLFLHHMPEVTAAVDRLLGKAEGAATAPAATATPLPIAVA